MWELHEGWNYYKFEDGEKPAYNAFRFRGLKAGSCMVGEAVLYGVEVVADENPTKECSPTIMIDGINVG